MHIRVFNYNSLEKAHEFEALEIEATEAHTDYIRYIAVHPTLPYLLSSSDDMSIKKESQFEVCWRVSEALFHPALPIILTGSEDGTVRIWHGSTYRLEATLSYFLERVWSISVLKGSNTAALGYDEGTVVIKLGRPPHGCCCCRARCSSTCAPVCNGGRVEDDSAQKRPFTAKAVPMEQGWEPFERRSEEVKRSEQNMDPVDSIFAELKKLKEEPPESQHGPESQPTPFIYEPPVVDQEVEMDTLPTPAVETPLPVPEPQTVPVPVQIVHETLTPWCTQPTPKVDATDWLFISDPTPMPPEKENQDGGIPELTQATPVPPAPIGTKPPSDSREKEDSFAETAIDKEKEEGDALERKGTEPKAEQPRCAADSGIFPEISIDIVTDLVGQKPPVPPVPAVPVQVKQLPKGKSPGKTGAEVSFAAMLLQRMRAAKRDSGANQKVSDRAEQDEQNPESAHPPAQVAPEDIHPLVISGLWVGDCFVYISHAQRLTCMVAGSQDSQNELGARRRELLATALQNGSRSLHNRIARFLENQGYQAEALQISKDKQDDEHRFELATQLGKLQMAADIIVSISAQASLVLLSLLTNDLAGSKPATQQITSTLKGLDFSPPSKRVRVTISRVFGSPLPAQDLP
eukprot:Skav223998  [mRNA]  locus=scaffold2619:1073:11571:- [translate_table: standard]